MTQPECYARGNSSMCAPPASQHGNAPGDNVPAFKQADMMSCFNLCVSRLWVVRWLDNRTSSPCASPGQSLRHCPGWLQLPHTTPTLHTQHMRCSALSGTTVPIKARWYARGKSIQGQGVQINTALVEPLPCWQTVGGLWWWSCSTSMMGGSMGMSRGATSRRATATNAACRTPCFITHHNVHIGGRHVVVNAEQGTHTRVFAWFKVGARTKSATRWL